MPRRQEDKITASYPVQSMRNAFAQLEKKKTVAALKTAQAQDYIDNRLKHELFQLKEEITQLRIKGTSTQYAYPYQGITDTINSAEARIRTLAENAKDEILQNFDRNIKIMEDACANILLDVHPLKDLPNNILRQNQSNHNIQNIMLTELHNKIDILQASLEKAEAKARTQEEKINILLKSSNRERTSIPIQRTLNTQLNPPEKPLGGFTDLNMICIKNFKAQLKQKCSKKKPKMDWNKFGNNEWQVVETSLKEQRLPPVRNEDLFLFGNRPKGKTYEITKYGIAVLLLIHVCIVGRAFRRSLMAANRGERSSDSSIGMSANDLELLPCFDFKAREKGNSPVDCAVCLENFKMGDKCRLLPNCNHSFH
ncbi:hypothetical protein AAC387_Pa05g0004 [Persea americana]